MCPSCLTTTGLAVASAVSMGGRTALTVRAIGRKRGERKIIPNSNKRKTHDVNTDSKGPEDSVAR